MEDIRNINDRIKGLDIEIIEERDNCWLFTDDVQGVKELFGFENGKFDEDTPLYYSRFELIEAGGKYTVILE